MVPPYIREVGRIDGRNRANASIKRNERLLRAIASQKVGINHRPKNLGAATGDKHDSIATAYHCVVIQAIGETYARLYLLVVNTGNSRAA